MARVYNIRKGFGRKDDVFPRDGVSDSLSGPLGGIHR